MQKIKITKTVLQAYKLNISSVQKLQIPLQMMMPLRHSQLADRRKQLTKRQFVKMADTDNCLNYLLPARRDSEIICSLRTATEYPLICAKSTRFKKSFLPYALFNYQ